MNTPLVIGLDYGTDSVRSVLIDTTNGAELASKVFYYPRWAKGMHCDAPNNQFRQHPLDYVEGLEESIKGLFEDKNAALASRVKGIAVDTTGSTPVAVDERGTPLSLLPEFAEDPDAMFILWKDHTAIKEAEEINTHAEKFETNYLKYVGGIYSSEWYWAKILRTLRVSEAMQKHAYSWVEHCDWIPFLLTGGKQVKDMKRSRCAAGHKAMWHEEFEGLPPEDFWASLDPLLSGLRERLFTETHTSDLSAGTLSTEWAAKLGLSEEVVVGVGAFDAHMGAVGGEIQPYSLSRIMGTSTCDILVAPMEEMGDNLIKGICGQVDGSVLPGMLGMEAGQSAFGDVYAWFRNLISWPIDELLPQDIPHRAEVAAKMKENIIPALSKAAAAISPHESAELALDWMNGRRTPDANQALKGAIFNLNLGSDAPRVFRALVEATCFGARAIVERFGREGVPIKEMIGLGGVAKKSPFVMQTLANVLNMPIKIARSEQTCALGAGMFAAVAAGIYSDLGTAQSAMGQGFEDSFEPIAEHVALYDKLYANYMKVGALVEQMK
ncbi:MAG: ribulokinase [Bacteroidota bacterium]